MIVWLDCLSIIKSLCLDVIRQACSSQFLYLYLSSSTKMKTNTETEMLSRCDLSCTFSAKFTRAAKTCQLISYYITKFIVHILHPACRCGEKACALIISHEDKRVFLHWEHWYNFYTLSQQAGGPWQHRNGWISCCTLNSLSCWHSKRKTMNIGFEKIQNNDE